MTLGEKILMLRKARGMNQEQLAEQLSVSRQAVSKWELNEAVPDVARVVAMSELFGVTTDYLLKHSDAAPAEGARQEDRELCAAGTVSDRKWLGMAVTVISALALIAVWIVEEIEGVFYLGYGSGLLAHFQFDGRFFLFFLALVFCLIGGIRILCGKPFLFAVFTFEFWEGRAGDSDKDNYSQETRRFLNDDPPPDD